MIASQWIMRTYRRALITASVMAAGTLSAGAQQPAGLATARLARASASVTTASVSRVRSNTLTTIQGNALSSTNGAMNDTLVRLRDARFGRIVDTQLTGKSGLFAFKAVDPGTYIVEMIANDESVL